MKRGFAVVLSVLFMFLLVACGLPAENVSVRFHIDGTVVYTATVAEGEEASYTPDARDGYTFDGWYSSEALTGEKVSKIVADKDTDLYGTWREDKPAPVQYTVTFVVDGKRTEVKVNAGETASFATPGGKEGFVFDGWYLDEACEGEKFSLTTPVTGDLTLYAGWREIAIPQTFTVTFELDGGTADPAIPVQSVKEGEKATEPSNEPTREGYRFTGWYLGTQAYDFDTPVTQNITLTAVWEEIIPVTDGVYTATSAANGHNAAFAGDGVRSTYWQAADTEAQELTVDLGGIQDVRTVRQIFAEEAVWDFEIKASTDNEHWAVLTDCTKEEAADTYDLVVNGFFRYVKLCVAAGVTASSCEFSIGVSDLEEGTNIALGMKGGADCWAAGYETEMAFDGNYSSFYCANDSNMGHYLAVEWTYSCYVNFVDFYMVDPGVFNYEVEGRLPDGSWIKLENAADHDGQVFRLQVDREISAVLIRVFGTPDGNSKWVSCAEMNVYGFKDAAAAVTPETESGYKVYDLGESYLHSVKGASAEYSEDGTTWTAIDAADGVAGKHVRYVRIAEADTAQIYATRFETDLARYIVPTIMESDANAGYEPYLCTMNPENVWAQEKFWCAPNAGGEHTLELDFGNVCILQRWVYTFQDEVSENIYKLKIEYSEDKASWTTAFDNFDAPAAGQTFTGTLENVSARYIKITVEKIDQWTNCKWLQIYGVGAPVRPVEIR